MSLGEPQPAVQRRTGAAHRRSRLLASGARTPALLGATLVMLVVGPATALPVRPRVMPEVPVTPENLVDRTANNSPQLAADPTEARFVVLTNRLDGPDFGCALQASGDGGRSWVSAQPVPELPPGADKCYAPEAAFDRHGKLYYLFVGLHGAGNSPMGVFLTTSTDRANHFSPPRQVLGEGRYQVRMAIDPAVGSRGRLHLVWLETTTTAPLGGLPPPPNPIMAAHSDDGGATFSPAVQVSDPSRQRVVAPAIALTPDHALHVLYYDLEADVVDYQGLEGPTWEGNWSLVTSSSDGEGGHFGPGSVVDDGLLPPERVMLIYTMASPSFVADKGGRLYAGWYDARNGDWDVFVRRSDDGGRTWTSPVRVNDDPVHDGRHQYLPRLAVAPDARLDVTFYDRRGNPENRGNDVYYAYSLDGGAHFAPNAKLTSIDSDSKIGPRYDVPSAAGLNEFGSRIALLSDDSTVLAAWTDTRNTGRAFPAQDIFATSIVFADGAGGSRWPAVGGVVAAAVVLGLVAGLAVRRKRSRPQSQT